MKVYTTDRLILRRLRLSESNLLLDYIQSNRKFLEDWEPIRDESYYTIESMKETIENEDRKFEDRSGLSLYIFNKGENQVIGNVSLSHIVYGVFQSCFLGYKLAFSEINQGKITEALKKITGVCT